MEIYADINNSSTKLSPKKGKKIIYKNYKINYNKYNNNK